MTSMHRYNQIFLVAIAGVTLLDCTTNAFQNPSRLVHTASCRRPSFVTRSATVSDYDTQIASAEEILYRTAETKSEDPESVLSALEDLEKLMRTKRKAEPETAAAKVLENLDGAWRLLFTTGTKKTQEKFKTRINYFPIKAMQSFKVKETPMQIENGIYLGDFSVIKFFGTFEFDLIKSKLEFDFDEIAVFGIRVPLKKGEAAKIGASSGLGSESNVKNAQKDKAAFFNWISADDKIATARGGGGGLALWTRVIEEQK